MNRAKNITITLAVLLLIVSAGCKKNDTAATEAGSDTQMTQQDYERQAEKEITEDNMEDELQKIEQQIEQEAAAQ